jgi:hypothetical protein
MLGCGQDVVWRVQWGTAALYTESVRIIERIFLVRALRALGGVEIYLHPFLTSALGGDEWLASRPGRLTYWKEPRYPLNGRLDGL